MTKTYIKKLSYAIFYYKDEACTILHREDGPACEYTAGDKAWYLNGKISRIDGPAYITYRGYKEWFLDGKEYSEEEYKKLVKMVAFL